MKVFGLKKLTEVMEKNLVAIRRSSLMTTMRSRPVIEI